MHLFTLTTKAGLKEVWLRQFSSVHVLFDVISNQQHAYTGADPGFAVGGGGALQIMVPSVARGENFGGISCEKSRF